jgi:hypothetical protein
LQDYATTKQQHKQREQHNQRRTRVSESGRSDRQTVTPSACTSTKRSARVHWASCQLTSAAQLRVLASIGAFNRRSRSRRGCGFDFLRRCSSRSRPRRRRRCCPLSLLQLFLLCRCAFQSLPCACMELFDGAGCVGVHGGGGERKEMRRSRQRILHGSNQTASMRPSGGGQRSLHVPH